MAEDSLAIAHRQLVAHPLSRPPFNRSALRHYHTTRSVLRHHLTPLTHRLHSRSHALPFRSPHLARADVGVSPNRATTVTMLLHVLGHCQSLALNFLRSSCSGGPTPHGEPSLRK